MDIVQGKSIRVCLRPWYMLGMRYHSFLQFPKADIIIL